MPTDKIIAAKRITRTKVLNWLELFLFGLVFCLELICFAFFISFSSFPLRNIRYIKYTNITNNKIKASKIKNFDLKNPDLICASAFDSLPLPDVKVSIFDLLELKLF